MPGELKKINAQARNRTGGPTMATLDFTTKPLALVIIIMSNNYVQTTEY